MLRIAVLLSAASVATGIAAQELAEPVRIEAAGEPIDTGMGHAAPFFGDIDADGTQDLLVGQFSDGVLWIYLNEGTSRRPKLVAGVRFKAGGEDGRVPTGCCTGFVPQLVDIDGDGFQDILSGSWPGELFLFRGSPQETFSAPELLKDKYGQTINVGGGVERLPDGSLRIVGDVSFEETSEGTFAVYRGQRYKATRDRPIRSSGSASVAHAADWDGDGDYDLLVGNIYGHVHLIPNEGMPHRLSFGEPQQLEAAGQPLAVAHNAAPFAADWDEDGDLDLLVGAVDGSVSLFRNIGSPGGPRLTGPQILVEPGEAEFSADAPTQPRRGIRSKPCVADWNSDGLPDLLVGDVATQAADLSQLTPREIAEHKRIQKELDLANERYRELGAKLFGPDRVQEKPEYDRLAEELRELTQQMQELQSKLPKPYEVHGWVWLFARRTVAVEAEASTD